MTNLPRVPFMQGATEFCFGTTFAALKERAPVGKTFLITDESLLMHYEQELKAWPVITVPAGASSKSLNTLDDVIRQLIALDADREALLIGFGGGVVTDLSGFVAGIYKRGVRCAFVPTTLLAMVDASVGGKNGLDIGAYKNMIGLIRQPEFLHYDFSLLKTLPEAEWINGFAEIIKHACILDEEMFRLLEGHDLNDFRNDETLLASVIERNALLKSAIVEEDEQEQGRRKLLNFGHTLGHAIENSYRLPHGCAVAIGIVFAARLSEKETGFKDASRIIRLLAQYQLPVTFDFSPEKILSNLYTDKKRRGSHIDFILLEETGRAVIKSLSLETLTENLGI